MSTGVDMESTTMKGLVDYGKDTHEYVRNLETALGLRAIGNEGKGDCFFLALRQLLASVEPARKPDAVSEMRRKIVAAMRAGAATEAAKPEHDDDDDAFYLFNGEKDKTFGEFCDRMEKGGEFANELVLVYASKVYCLKILVFSNEQSQVRHIYTPEVWTASVCMLNRSDFHYEALVERAKDADAIRKLERIGAEGCDKFHSMYHEVVRIDYIEFGTSAKTYARNIERFNLFERASTPISNGDGFYETLSVLLKKAKHKHASDTVATIRSRICEAMRERARSATDDGWLCGEKLTLGESKEEYCRWRAETCKFVHPIIFRYAAFVYEIDIVLWLTNEQTMHRFCNRCIRRNPEVHMMLVDDLTTGGAKYVALVLTMPHTVTRLALECAVPGRDAATPVRVLERGCAGRDAATPVRFLERGCAGPRVCLVE